MADIARKRAALGMIWRMIVGAVVVGGLWHRETRAVLWEMIREEWQDDNYDGKGDE